MTTQLELGRIAERLAQKYVIGLGYEILATNWQFGHLELDIIAKDKGQLVIIEVKSRNGIRYEHPSEAVTDKKIKFIVDAAEAYIIENNIDADTRFDVITVIFFGENHELEHFADAFYPTI